LQEDLRIRFKAGIDTQHDPHRAVRIGGHLLRLLILQGLADKTGIDTTLGQRLIRMFAVAFINGLIISAIVFGFNMLIGNDVQLALVVSTALMSVVFLASFMGTLTPILLEKIGINPAVASGPFITTANDLIGYGVYFGLAHLLLKL